MTRTLITVLGRGQARPEGRGPRRYQRVHYDFGNGELKATEFFEACQVQHCSLPALQALISRGDG